MNNSKDNWEKPHTELEEIFKKHGAPKLPVPTLKNLEALRKGFNKVAARYSKGPLAKRFLPAAGADRNWSETDRSIPVRDGSRIKIRIYTPKSAPGDGVPVAMVMHGGGWFMGDLETENLLCQVLCSARGLVVVNVDFRLYPEVGFGVPITDVYDAVKWTAANISEYSGNPRKGFYLGGNSGGGAFAAISTFLARDEGLQPPITGNFLSCPILTDERRDENGEIYASYAPDRNKSYESNKDAPLMNRAMQQSIQNLIEFPFDSPLLTPFNHADFGNIPPTYIQVCGLDPWRDLGIIYGEELEKKGNKVDLKVYPGLPHCWWTTYPGFKVSEEWMRDLLGGIDWLMSSAGKKGEGSKL